jgi:FtsP/CotA-like multicopper oxidase with cupredoxin domain
LTAPAAQWTVNGEVFDPDVVQARVKRGTKEIWVFENGGGGWHHPIHVHHNEFRILSRDGAPPQPFERGRKDVVNLLPGESVRVLMEFSAFVGRYPIHCHNTVHEDHAMMALWEIVP